MSIAIRFQKQKSKLGFVTSSLKLLQVCIITALGFSFFLQTTLAQGNHTFHITGQQPFEGELLSVQGSTVEIKHLESDGVIKMPIASLSLQDKKFLLKWVRNKRVYSQEIAPLPDGWATLRIHFPKGYDFPLSSELGAISRIGGRVHEGNFPIGFWVKINIYRTDPLNSQFRSTYLQFNGNSDWYLSFRAGKLYRSFKPGGPSKVVAAVIPSDNETEFLRSLRIDTLTGREIGEDQKILADRVSFRVSTIKGLEALVLFNHPIAWLTIDGHYLFDENQQLDINAANRLVKLAPQSFSMVGGDDKLMILLSRIPSIEHLILKELKSSPWTFEGFQSLRNLPRLQSLTYRTRNNKNTSFLEGFDKLKILRVSPTSPYGSKIKIPELKSLEALSIPHTFTLDNASLAGLPKIKYLDVKGIEPSYRLPKNLIRTYWGKAGGDYNTLVKKGFYSNLRSLTTVEHVDYDKLPNLSSLKILGITPDLDRLAKAPRLRHLQIYEVQQADLEQLANLPNMQDLETITFSRGTIKDLSPLAKLPKLKQILLGSLRGAPNRIDLSLFPLLESFIAYNVYQMESIFGIASHPNLIYLKLQDCREVKNLGNPSPNSKLDSIYIKDAFHLENLEAFKQMTGLKAVWISGCTRITGPLYIEDNNDLKYFKIYDSGSLPDRPKH
ncbi:MAG: hypothetical protein QM496_06980 [Verrucomicrobiota bacterium]